MLLDFYVFWAGFFQPKKDEAEQEVGDVQLQKTRPK